MRIRRRNRYMRKRWSVSTLEQRANLGTCSYAMQGPPQVDCDKSISAISWTIGLSNVEIQHFFCAFACFSDESDPLAHRCSIERAMTTHIYRRASLSKAPITTTCNTKCKTGPPKSFPLADTNLSPFASAVLPNTLPSARKIGPIW
jgi:hypothetical protein